MTLKEDMTIEEFEQELASLRSRNIAISRLPINQVTINQMYELRADYLILGCVANADALGNRIDTVYRHP